MSSLSFFILTYLAAVNRCEISLLLAVRRKKSGEREKQVRLALAFELIDLWMRKFNKRKLYFVVPHLGRLQNNPVERQTIDQALLLKMTEGASDSYATCTDDFCNVLMR